MNFDTTLAPIRTIPALVSTDESSLRQSDLAPAVSWTKMGKSEHFVQFYERDDFLMTSVSAFIGAVFGQGEAAIVIATQAHRDALDQRLRADGLDPAELEALGHYYP